MELRHLRYFIAVAEERSFLAAAARLRVAQSALSKQIRDLEDELGTTVFERGPRGVNLTAAGRAFLVEARRTLDLASRAVASARGAAEGRASQLHFAHGEVAAYGTSIERLLAGFRNANPDVHAEISSYHDGEIFHALRERRVDVGSVFVAEWPAAGFSGHRLLHCTITGVLLPPRHPPSPQASLARPDAPPPPCLNSPSRA